MITSKHINIKKEKQYLLHDNKEAVSENPEDNGLFSNLASSLRIEILKILQTAPSTQSKLASSLKITIQGLQRHIDRLLKSGLIKKDMEGNLSISSIGVVAMEQIPTFLFLSKHQKYFQTHDFSGIPKRLIQRLGDLYNCEFLDDVMQNWQRAKETIENYEEYFVAVSSIQPIEFFDIAKIRLKKGVKFKLGFPKTRIVAKGYADKRSKTKWDDAIKKSQIEEFFVDNVPVTTVVTEKEAQLLFANTKTGH